MPSEPQILALVALASLFGGALGGSLWTLTLWRRFRAMAFELADLNSRLIRVVRRQAAETRWGDNVPDPDVPSSFSEAPGAALKPADFAARKFATFMGKKHGSQP